MADIKVEAKVPTPVDPWKTDQATWQYVTIPQENALGEVHAKLSLNRHEFFAGQTYLVPKEAAESLTERLHVYNKSCIRILQPRRDFDALSKIPLGNSSAGNVNHADPSTF